MPYARAVTFLCCGLLVGAIASAGCGADTSPGGVRSTGRGAASAPTAFDNPSAAAGAAAQSAFGNPAPTPLGGAAGNSGATSPEPEECAGALVQTSQVKPVITLVIDGSGSMCETFGGATRWTSLRTALLDPADGLVLRLQAAVQFGMTLYDGGIDLTLARNVMGASPNPACAGMYAASKAMGACPQLIEVPNALGNFAAIDAAYPQAELGGSTPTDKAMNQVIDNLVARVAAIGPDDEKEPYYVILATDGQPNDICAGGVGGDGSAQRAGVIAAVDRGLAAGIQTYIISLAGGDAGLQAHLQEVAMHGGTGSPPFTPMTKDDLVSTLAKIIGGAIGCQVMLNGAVNAGQECSGFVEVNGAPLPCNDPNGWRLLDPSTIELTGKACDDFTNSPGAMLRAGFPCGVFVPT